MPAPTREQILDAAARLYGEHGFRGTTTRRIAEATALLGGDSVSGRRRWPGRLGRRGSAAGPQALSLCCIGQVRQDNRDIVGHAAR